MVADGDPWRLDEWGQVTRIAEEHQDVTGRSLWLCREPLRRFDMPLTPGRLEGRVLMEPSWSLITQTSNGSDAELNFAAWLVVGLLNRDARFRLNICPECAPGLLMLKDSDVGNILWRQIGNNLQPSKKDPTHACPVCGSPLPELVCPPSKNEETPPAPQAKQLTLCA